MESRRPDHLLAPALALVVAILLGIGAVQTFASTNADEDATTSANR